MQFFVTFYFRKPIPLSENEGIYVQDCKTGKVKTVEGPQSYLLKETEALWEKELTPEVERMLKYAFKFTNKFVYFTFQCFVHDEF